MKKLFLIIFCLISFQSTYVIPDFERESKSSSIFNSLAEKRAHDAYQLGDFAQAASIYTKLLASSPYDAQNNYNLGCVLHKQKKYDDAQNYFNRAIESAKPDSKLQEQALFNRGNNFAALKKYDDAIADYKKVLKINPENVSAKKNLKACEQMKKEQKKQDQQQQKDKNKDQKDQQDQNSSNQDSLNQNSSDGSDQDQSSNDQSTDSKKEPKGKQKKQGKNKSQDQQGDTEKDSQEKEEGDQKQEDSLQKSKKQKPEDKQTGKEQKQQEMEHEKSSQKSKQEQKQSTKFGQNGKEEAELQKPELQDAYAQEMMGKPSDDHRLDKRSAMLLDKLDDYEKNIQKKLLQMNVTKQGAQKHGQKNW